MKKQASKRPVPITRAPSSSRAPRAPVHTSPVAIASTTKTRKTRTGGTEVLRDDEVRSYVEELAEAPHVARVKVCGGVTKNMGDFEFIRVDVSIDMPCLPDLDGDHGIVATKKFCSDKVEEFIAEEIDLAVGTARK